jgi:hypothetical protein
MVAHHGARIRCGPAAAISTSNCGLIDLHHPRRLHDRGLLLPLGELRSLGAIRINPGELLAVVVVDRDLPVPVLAPLVFTQLGAFSSFSHEFPPQVKGHYGNTPGCAQVARYELTREDMFTLDGRYSDCSALT